MRVDSKVLLLSVFIRRWKSVAQVILNGSILSMIFQAGRKKLEEGTSHALRMAA